MKKGPPDDKSETAGGDPAVCDCVKPSKCGCKISGQRAGCQPRPKPPFESLLANWLEEQDTFVRDFWAEVAEMEEAEARRKAGRR